MKRLLPFPLAAAILTAAPATEIRVMTFNASLNRPGANDLAAELANGDARSIQRVAEIVQELAPDIVLINEFDHNGEVELLQLFQDNYLSVGQRGADPITFPYLYAPPSNTGVNSGLDLDNNGSAGMLPADGFGFGEFPGQYNMALFSRYPIETEKIRTFQKFLWKDMPANVMPPTFYSEEEKAVFRLSSKNHCDVPVTIGSATVHLLLSHPTPPIPTNGQERNERRNTDEIRLWADYITPGKGDYLVDDMGGPGGLESGVRFIIMGDQNADPVDGDSRPPAINQLLESPFVDNSVTPTGSFSGSDTAIFSGRLRVDYVLPSVAGLKIDSAFVAWPKDPAEPLFAFLAADRNSVSDHRPVVVDLTVEPILSAAVPDLGIERGASTVVLRWSAQPGVAYAVEQSATLSTGTWSGDGAPEVNVTGGNARAVAAPRVDQQFFRVRAAFE